MHKRYVFLSFVFMGWGFYELSGGNDFEPRGIRIPSAEKQATAPARPKPAAQLVQVRADTLVARPVLKSRTDQVRKAQAEPEPEPEITEAEAAARLAQVRASLSSGLEFFPQEGGANFRLASLEQGALSLETTNPEPESTSESTAITTELSEPEPDIREVTGTRVNMRDGPGTIYPVVARLNIGREVEVLGDSGTGWLRLRVLPERQIGWIASSLVSKKVR
ncbi:SH3 domain-containing protein [Primorskyibacter sp. S87]|uniref:SH3 domain-containing protein n=1 Tax=Primorskyibacter sp. S87 TaxID=3415126 RepID=UPI003C7D588D